MSNIFFPNVHFNNIYEISPEFLKYKGITHVLLDIDNTLVPYSVKIPDKKVIDWLRALKGAGITTAVLSNATEERASVFTENIPEDIFKKDEIITIGKAGKPLGKGFKRAARLLGADFKNMCIIGDQFFTDILGGNINGVFTIWVTPIDKNESLFIKSKRVLERPIISSYRRSLKKMGGDTVGLLGVIGYPIEHSVSPQLHNVFCQVTGFNFFYEKFCVAPESLEQSFEAFKAKGFKGLNVTVPHKENIMKFLDSADHWSKKIGAVNTIVFKNGKTYGYNTDMYGFVNAVKHETGFDFKDKKILILGAGGAARGVAAGCIESGATVDVCNRTISKARELAEIFGGQVIDWEDGDFSEKFKEYDLIANTTSAGMRPQEDILPITVPFEFRKGQVCFDAIYDPERTLLLKKAEKEGALAINGMGMLFFQGLEAFKIWTKEAGCPEITEEQVDSAVKLLKERGIKLW